MNDGALFNTAQETAVRIVLCLSALPRPATLDEIAAVDLVATYMKAFGYGEVNLHGDNPFAMAEFGARRRRVWKGLALLVVRGLAVPRSDGDAYTATEAGNRYAYGLHGDYVSSYCQAVRSLIVLGMETVVDRVWKVGG